MLSRQCRLASDLAIPSFCNSVCIHIQAKKRKKAQCAEQNERTARLELVRFVVEHVPHLRISGSQQSETMRLHLQPTSKKNATLCTASKQFLIDVAYSPIRGMRQCCKLYRIGFNKLHGALLSCALLLHFLQIGCGDVFPCSALVFSSV